MQLNLVNLFKLGHTNQMSYVNVANDEYCKMHRMSQGVYLTF